MKYVDFIPLKKNLGTTTQQVNKRETVKTKEENCKYIIVIGFMALDNVFFFLLYKWIIYIILPIKK